MATMSTMPSTPERKSHPLMSSAGNGYQSGHQIGRVSNGYHASRTPIQRDSNQFHAKPTIVSTPGASQAKMKNVSYEAYAPRSANQRNRLSRIQSLTSGPISTKMNDAATSSSQEKNSFLDVMRMTPNLDGASPSKANIAPRSKANESDKIVDETLNQARKSASHITEILTHTSKLHSTLTQTSSLAYSIQSRHTSLLQHSCELSSAAERLQKDVDMLTAHATEIGLPLQHYDAIDNLGTSVGVLFKNNQVVKGLSRVQVDTPEFIQVLDKVDAATVFFGERADAAFNKDMTLTAKEKLTILQTSGSLEYQRRSLALQEACFDLLREAIRTRIATTTNQISSALDLTRQVVKGDILEASLIYTRFHGISSRSCTLLQIVSSRMDKGIVNGEGTCPYKELWTQCRDEYIRCRESLLRNSVKSHLDVLKGKHGLIGMTRLASVFLMRLCTVETSLYLDFFGPKNENGDTKKENNTNKATPSKTSSSKKDATTLASHVMSNDGTYYDASFQAFLDNLCQSLHRTIRRGLVSILDLDSLCQIVSVLREEQSLASASPTTMAAARTLGKIIVDSQERLIFSANSALGKEVLRFKALPTDLDYPEKLRKCRELQRRPEEKKDDTQVIKIKALKGVDISSEMNKEEEQLQLQMQIYESWFPPIRSVLKVLSKIFRVVESKVFEDIALTSVQACAKSLKDGSIYVEQKSGVLHSDLFLVKHLLVSFLEFIVSFTLHSF